ncbi:MAG: PEP-CTERM sorting domain-containing protein [Herminiimonas sp.]|nr:PEP-CTERM sorting domain-containing protein [Herminiimonas sp.]
MKNPLTLDFTIANPLGANDSYSFGVTGVENGAFANLLDFRISAGTALTTFTLADFHGMNEYYGGYLGGSLSRLGVSTDALGNIDFFDIIFRGRSPVDPQLIYVFSTQRDPGNLGVSGPGISLDYDPALNYRTPSAGGYGCYVACGPIITSSISGVGGGVGIGAVPEPASWLMMIVGFGLIGSALRRQTRKPITIGG